MRLAKALDEKKMDKRLVDRLLAEGKVTKADLDTYHAGLADEAGNFELVDDGKKQENTITE